MAVSWACLYLSHLSWACLAAHSHLLSFAHVTSVFRMEHLSAGLYWEFVSLPTNTFQKSSLPVCVSCWKSKLPTMGHTLHLCMHHWLVSFLGASLAWSPCLLFPRPAFIHRPVLGSFWPEPGALEWRLLNLHLLEDLILVYSSLTLNYFTLIPQWIQIWEDVFCLLFSSSFVFGSHLAMIKGYSWTCTQESLLVGLRDHVVCWGLNWVSCM